MASRFAGVGRAAGAPHVIGLFSRFYAGSRDGTRGASGVDSDVDAGSGINAGAGTAVEGVPAAAIEALRRQILGATSPSAAASACRAFLAGGGMGARLVVPLGHGTLELQMGGGVTLTQALKDAERDTATV